MNFRRASRRRPGIAEIVGSMLAIALTVIVGVAVFSYVNSESGVTERQLGVSVGQTVNGLAERFVVPQANYNYPNPPCSPCKSSSLTIYFYNDGTVSNQFQQIEVYNSTAGSVKLDFTFTSSYVTDLNNPINCKVVATTTYENPLLGTGAGSLVISVSSLSSITLTLPQQSSCYPPGHSSPYQFVQGDAYFVKVLGIYGNSVTYYQVM